MIRDVDTCPDLEDLAAFIDGKLAGEERARVVKHLADCPACYEIFAGATRFQLEETTPAVLPPIVRFPVRSASLWAGALAAALLATVGVTWLYRASQQQPQIDPANWVAQIGNPGEAAETLWSGGATRGSADEDDAIVSPKYFQLGVRLFDLRVSLAADAFARSQVLLGQIYALTEEERQEWASFYKDAVSELEEGGSIPADFQARAAATEEKLAAGILNPHFALGRWAEAGRLASLSRAATFFQDEANQQFLRWLRKQERIAEPVQGHLEHIQTILDKGELQQQDFSALDERFTAILTYYFRPQSEF